MVAPPMSGSIQTFMTDPPVKMAYACVEAVEVSSGDHGTHHAYVTELMPSNREEFERIEDDSEAGDDPEGKDDHCVHYDLPVE